MAPLGVCSPIRYTLHVTLAKLKLVKPMPGSRIQIRVIAAKNEKKIDVLASDKSDQVQRNSNVQSPSQVNVYEIRKSTEF